MTSPRKYLRRTLQVVALVGTLLIGILALALIASQTPWFRDWLRGYVERQAKQYVNGTVSIGSLGGNLFYGIQLGDVAVDFNGERVMTLKNVEIKYSIAELVSQGVTIRQIRLDEPYVLARRDAGGWNLAKIVKKQEQEADRKGPRKPISLPDIQIVNGRAAIDDRAPSASYRYPSRIDALNVNAGFAYEPVHYSLTLNRLTFAGKAPDLTVQNLTGRIATRDDQLNFEKVFLQTPQSSVTIDGVVRDYLAKPSMQVTVSATKFSLPELSGVVPPLQGYHLHPTFDVKAQGLQESLELALNVKSEAGTVSGTVTADLEAPDLGVRGSVSVQNLDLAPLLKNPAQKSDITGHAKLDLRVVSAATRPASPKPALMSTRAEAGAIDRLRGRVDFEGPKVVAAGHTATNVKMAANFTGRRIGLDGRANAYGGSATAKGFIVVPGPAGQPTQIDLAGRASNINLAGLPASIKAPRIPTNLNATAYHVKGLLGSSMAIEGTATMAESTIAGGTILSGTAGEFSLTSRAGRPGLQSLNYAARGEVRDMNLRRLGEAFQIVALATPEYDSRINTTFDVTGSGTTAMQIDAKGTATDSEMFGAKIPRVTYDVQLARGPSQIESLTYTAKGEVRDLNLQRVGETFDIAALKKPEYGSRINTQFDVSGSGTAIDNMRLDATGAATDSRVFGGTLPQMAYEAHLANGALNGRATGEFRDLDPSRISGNARLQGRASGSVDATFGIANVSAPITPEAVRADGRVTLTPSEIAGLKIDTAEIQGQYADRRGTLRQATIKGPDVEVQASGPIALDRTGQSNVKYHLAAANLETIGKLVDQPVAGSAILDGTITGNAASLVTTGTLDGSNLGYRDNKALDLNSTYTVTVPDLTFAQAEVKAQTTGTFVEIGGVQISTLTATTTYKDLKLDFQTHLAQSPSGGQSEKAAGREASGARELDANGSVVFHPDHQELHLPALSLRTEGVEWKTAPGVEPTIKYGNDRIEFVNVKLVNVDQTLDVAGTFALGDNPQFAGIEVHAKNVDIAQLEKLALMNRGFSGRLDADARITGSAKAPDVTGRLAVTNGGFQQFKYESLTAEGTYSGQRIGVDARLVQKPGVELTAKGTLPLAALRSNSGASRQHQEIARGEAIDLRIQSTEVELGIIQGFTNQVTNVTGTIQADVHVTGSAADPHLNGFIDLKNGGFGVVQGGVTYTGLNTRLDLEPDRIRVSRFQLLDDHGQSLTIQGELAIHEGQAGAVDIAIDSNNFELIDNQLGELQIESRLKLTGELRKPRLEGHIRTDAARLEIDKIMLLFSDAYAQEALPEVVSAQQTAVSSKGADDATRDALARGREIAEQAPPPDARAAEAAAPKTGIFSALELDVHVIAPDNLVVRGSDLRPGGPTAARVGSVNATVGADVQINKRENGPVTIRGTANTVRGFYEFQGRRFTIQRGGTMRFNGLPQINPDLNVAAERLIPNTGVTARIQIGGTARAPQISLSSTPPLDEADILSLIVFNRSVNELGTGERASLAETAGGIASGFVASPLGKSIGKALDVDLFEITTSDDVTGETAGGVTLGKQIGDKAFVRFRQQFGQRSFTEFMLEYQLAKFLRLETRISPETSGVANRLTQRRVERGGVDLIFFFSY